MRPKHFCLDVATHLHVLCLFAFGGLETTQKTWSTCVHTLDSAGAQPGECLARFLHHRVHG